MAELLLECESDRRSARIGFRRYWPFHVFPVKMINTSTAASFISCPFMNKIINKLRLINGVPRWMKITGVEINALRLCLCLKRELFCAVKHESAPIQLCFIISQNEKRLLKVLRHVQHKLTRVANKNYHFREKQSRNTLRISSVKRCFRETNSNKKRLFP